MAGKGDAGGSDERPYGRLAGFANVGSERGREDGCQPLVLLREALREGSPVLAGRKTAELEDYLEWTVTEALAARERSRERGFG